MSRDGQIKISPVEYTPDPIAKQPKILTRNAASHGAKHTSINEIKNASIVGVFSI